MLKSLFWVDRRQHNIQVSKGQSDCSSTLPRGGGLIVPAHSQYTPLFFFYFFCTDGTQPGVQSFNILTHIYFIKHMHSKRKRQKTGFQRIPLYKLP